MASPFLVPLCDLCVLCASAVLPASVSRLHLRLDHGVHVARDEVVAVGVVPVDLGAEAGAAGGREGAGGGMVRGLLQGESGGPGGGGREARGRARCVPQV